MAFSEKKYIKKLKQQKRSNPGTKEKYVPKERPRSVVFKSKKAYNRRNFKNIEEE